VDQHERRPAAVAPGKGMEPDARRFDPEGFRVSRLAQRLERRSLHGIGRVGHGPNVPWRPVAARPSVAPMATRHETAHQPAFRPSERVQALFILIGLVVLALIARAPGA